MCCNEVSGGGYQLCRSCDEAQSSGVGDARGRHGDAGRGRRVQLHQKKKLQDIATTGRKKNKQTGVLYTALPGDNMNPLHTLGSAIFIATAASAAAGYGKMRGSGGSDETSGQPQRSGTPPDQRATSSPNPRERWGTRQTPAWWRQHDPTSWERTSTPRHWHRTAAGRETTFTPVHWRAAAERRGGTSTPGSWRTDS